MARYESLGEDCDIREFIFDEEDVNAYMNVSTVKKAYSIYDFYDKALSSEKDILYNSFKASFEAVYLYESYVNIRSKMSISDIKKMKAYDGESYDVSERFMLADIDEAEGKKDSEDMEAIYGSGTVNNGSIESIDREKNKITGARRGTIIHKFMELLDFKSVKDIIDSDHADKELLKFIRNALEAMTAQDIFDEEESSVINPYKIRAMLLSDLGLRMIEADVRGRLRKEQQFSAGIPVDRLFEDNLFETSNKPLDKFFDSEMQTEITLDKACQTDREYSYDDMVIVQGIIDAFFIEDNRVILMDYKTDFADEDELIRRYKAQLDYYSYVLEQITGLKVAEKIIYSFYLEKDINID